MTDSGDDTRVNGGMAILGDEVFLGTLKAHVIALDANTGNVVWDVTAAAYRTGHSFTVAPWLLLLLSAVHRVPPIDGAAGSVIICAYTGKEVVG